MKYLLLCICFTILTLNAQTTQKSFTISYDPDYAPYSYVQDDKPYGLLIDFWKLWASQNGYKITFVNGVLWDDALAMAKEGKVDYFLGTEVYEPWMQGSKTFYKDKSQFFKLKHNKNNFTQADNIKVGVIGLDLEQTVLEYFESAEVFVFEDYESCINALINQKIDLLFDVKIAIEFYALQNRVFHQLDVLDEFEEQGDIQAISNSKDKIALFEKGLKNISYDALEQLERKWIINEKDYFYPHQKKPLVLNAKEEHYIHHQDITVGYGNYLAPYLFTSKQNNLPKGMVLELWELIQQEVGFSIDYKPFKNLNDEWEHLQQNPHHVMLWQSNKKTSDTPMKLSETYLSVPLALATLKEENIIKSFSQIEHQTIVVVENSPTHNLIKNEYPKKEFVLVSSIQEALKRIQNKDAYAFIEDELLLNYHIQQFGFDKVKVSGYLPQTLKLHFVVHEENEILLSILNKSITSMESVQIEKLFDKWNHIYFEKKFDYDLFVKFLIFIGILLLILVYRSVVLKRLNVELEEKVEDKTKQLQDLNKNLEHLVEAKSNELLKKEKILLQQSKLATMGELLQNISHQWRQPLSVIVGEASGLKYEKDLNILSDERLTRSIDKINKTALYMSDTIDDFKSYFKKNRKENYYSLESTIQRVISLQESNALNQKVTISDDIQDVQLYGVDNELIQVLLNIINNAIDAFKVLEKEQPKVIHISTKTDEAFVYITVLDNAGGIPTQIIDRIFEPYFTTKEHRGTGIGLYMSYEIVNVHMKGLLSVTNHTFDVKGEAYKGAQFTLQLPYHPKKV